MPNIKSAIKRVKVTAKKTEANRSKKTEVRNQIKKTKLAIAEGADNAEALARDTQKKIDQAAAHGRLHKNTAARRQSAIARQLNKSKQAE